MKRNLVLSLIIFIGLWAAVGNGSDLAPDTGDPADQTQAQAYKTPLKDKITYWVDTRLGRKTVKEHHLKVNQNGTRCDLCHGAQNPATPADDSSCFKCHGSADQVAKLTAKSDPNPHDSPHYGTDASCTACHKEHGPSEVICSSCHLFKYEKMK